MSDLLKRYERGEHEAVWIELARLGPLTNTELAGEANAVARATMTRVRRNAEIVADTLSRTFAYEVGFPPGEDVTRATQFVGEPVDPATLTERLARWAPLPAALQAFWTIVGHINFVGHLGLKEDDDEDDVDDFAWPDEQELDALQIYSPFAVVHEPHGGRKAASRLRADDRSASVESRLAAMFGQDDEDEDEDDDDDDELDERHLVITLDACMKANLGGAGPIVARTGPTADSALYFCDAPLRGFDGRSEMTFISYLRCGFSRGGFFGFDPHRDAELIGKLTHGLEPF